MKSEKIKLIWTLSIVAALLVIFLQGYWLYNQYRFATEKTVNDMNINILYAWNNYKTLQKKRLKEQNVNLKSYNTNFDHNSIIYLSDSYEEITNWKISIITQMGGSRIHHQNDTTDIKKPSKQLANYLRDKSKRIDSSGNNMRNKKTLKNKKKQVRKFKKGISEDISRTDSTQINTFSFGSKVSQGLIYDAVDLFLSNKNTPFNRKELENIIHERAGNIHIKIDTLILKNDSVLFEPKVVKNLSISNSNITCFVPYNPLKGKIARIIIPIVPTQVIRSMAYQIIACLILILVLIITLLLQIKTISRQMHINELRKNFVSTTIHELKRPVQTLKSIVFHLQNSGSKQPENTHILDDARIETDNLTSYLQKLREVNEAESVSDSLHLSYFDIVILVQENVERIKKTSNKPLILETYFPDFPLMITADKMAMSNIMANLLENSVKYSGEKAEIFFNIQLTNNKLHLDITDKGIGISQFDLNHVFEPFFRSKNQYVASLPGMGLGLSYVKMIVEAHHGSIRINSKLNNGTTVSIEIPAL